jgi:hypothetical protein
METEELQLQLAKAIERMAAIELLLGDVASSLSAIRLALHELSPERFEPLYAKYYEAAECEQVRQLSSTAAKALLEIAKRLKPCD